VAIIDDGIDSRLARFRGQIAGGRSFLKRPDREDRTVDYWVSPGGHGTEMAMQIPVHMIYESWSINTKGFSIEYQEIFRNKVQNAYDNGITIFCAASDHSKTNEEGADEGMQAAFGASIKIGATTADKNPYSQIVLRITIVHLSELFVLR
jgi:hypothetical protein